MINCTQRNKIAMSIRKQEDEALFKAGFEEGYKVGCEHTAKAYEEALADILKKFKQGETR